MVINYYYSSFNYPIQTKLSQIKDTHGLKKKHLFIAKWGTGQDKDEKKVYASIDHKLNIIKNLFKLHIIGILKTSVEKL